MHKEVFNEATL